MSVMLAFGLALGSLSYKQQVLASSAIASQYAFYAADAALECALYADQHENAFNFSDYTEFVGPGPLVCGEVTKPYDDYEYYSGDKIVVRYRLPLDSDTRCADVTVYKPQSGTVYLFSQGYDVSCSALEDSVGGRIVTRGINVRYSISY